MKTWSILQINLTAPHNLELQDVCKFEIRFHFLNPRLGMADPSEGRPSCTGSVIGLGPTDLTEEKKKQLKMDMIAIMTAIMLQDGPFFCLRMMLIFRSPLSSKTNL
jgi:hypothetical protein